MPTTAELLTEATDAINDVKEYFETGRDADIAALDAKLAEADAAIAGVQAAQLIQVYIDGINGSDANDGSQASPYETLNAALARQVTGVPLKIILVGDVFFDNSTTLKPGYIEIASEPVNAHKLTWSPVRNGGGTASTFLSIVSGDPVELVFRGVVIELSERGAGTVIYDNQIQVRGPVTVSIIGCEFEVSGANPRALFGLIGDWLDLYVVTTSGDPMDGHWIQGVSAGAAPASVSQLRSTNLSTL